MYNNYFNFFVCYLFISCFNCKPFTFEIQQWTESVWLQINEIQNIYFLILFYALGKKKKKTDKKINSVCCILSHSSIQRLSLRSRILYYRMNKIKILN